MKHLFTIAFGAALLASAIPTASAARGDIQRACMASGSQAATRQRCNCIQGVANDTLSRGDQRTVAKWFTDPHQAQEVKMSKTAEDDTLWERYEVFGQLAQAACR